MNATINFELLGIRLQTATANTTTLQWTSLFVAATSTKLLRPRHYCFLHLADHFVRGSFVSLSTNATINFESLWIRLQAATATTTTLQYTLLFLDPFTKSPPCVEYNEFDNQLESLWIHLQAATATNVTLQFTSLFVASSRKLPPCCYCFIELVGRIQRMQQSTSNRCLYEGAATLPLFCWTHRKLFFWQDTTNATLYSKRRRPKVITMASLVCYVHAGR